jgi:SAM-dependent methyltransferase
VVSPVQVRLSPSSLPVQPRSPSPWAEIQVSAIFVDLTDPSLTIKGWLRYDVVARLLAQLSDVESVLEVGAGEGALGVRLARRYRYVGLELDQRSFETARRRFEEARVGSVLHGGLEVLPHEATFDLVCALEVLEHCENDAETLRDWALRLRPRGWLLLSVPAFADRFGPSDRKAGHHRRYDRDQLVAALEDAGLEPQSVQLYGFPLGNLLQVAWNTAARLRPASGSPAERTAASGRYFQPRERVGWLTRGVSAPGRVAQRSVIGRGRGDGFVALARRVCDATVA